MASPPGRVLDTTRDDREDNVTRKRQAEERILGRDLSVNCKVSASTQEDIEMRKERKRERKREGWPATVVVG